MVHILRATALFYISAILAACSITNPSVTKVTNTYFVVTHPLKYSVGDGKASIIVPIGFLTDLASIPKELWWWQSPFEAAMAPGIVHDYLYWEQSCEPHEADVILYLALKDTGMGVDNRRVIYTGVNWQGKEYWEENTIARNAGETRFLSESYTRTLQDAEFNPNTTLTIIYKGAGENGLIYPNTPNPSVKAVCVAALAEYEKTK